MEASPQYTTDRIILMYSAVCICVTVTTIVIERSVDGINRQCKELNCFICIVVWTLAILVVFIVVALTA